MCTNIGLHDTGTEKTVYIRKFNSFRKKEYDSKTCIMGGVRVGLGGGISDHISMKVSYRHNRNLVLMCKPP